MAATATQQAQQQQAQQQPQNEVNTSPIDNKHNIQQIPVGGFTNGTDGPPPTGSLRPNVGPPGIGSPGLQGSEGKNNKNKYLNSIPAGGDIVEMSGYRQESGGPPPQQSINNSDHTENDKIPPLQEKASFGHNPADPGGDGQFGHKPQDPMGYGLPYGPRGGYHHGGPMHDGPAMHHLGSDGPPMHHLGQSNSYGGHFNPAVRHPSYPAKGARPPPTAQAFNRGSYIGQPTATTPTLNQLLQSSNSVVHRGGGGGGAYQNSYSGSAEYGSGPLGSKQPGAEQGPPPPASIGAYNQGWPPRPMAPYPQQPSPYRQQPPPGSRGYSGSPGSNYPPASPSQQYPPQSYRHPYPLGASVNNNGSIGPSPGERVGSGGGSWSPGPPIHQNQSGQQGGPQGASQGPVPLIQEPPSPQQPPPPSHQQQTQQQQSQPQSQPSLQQHSQSQQLPSQQPPQQLQQHTSQPPQSSTPRAAEQSPTRHAPDQGDLTGQNSNDSSSGGGPAPGTPNSQGMRPTPSPTGSSGSRSMSPAVGQQSVAMPPRPSSGQSDSGNGPTNQHSRISHSPMTNQATPPLPLGQGGYPGAGAPHLHNYKMGPHQMPPHPPPQSQQMPPYSPQGPPQHQYSNYSVRGGMGYSGPGGYQGPPGGMPPGGGPPPQSQYPPRGPIPNHVQYPPSPYQHKVGYGGSMPPSPGSYNSHGSMGPPATHHPGMPPPPPPHHDGPMPPPPPASTPSQHDVHDPSSIITTNASSGSMTNVQSSGIPSGPPTSNIGVTSIVTTGPDGATLDEASQQSTLSNASAASGDDGSCTPGKSRKDAGGGVGSGGGVVGGGLMGYHGHPATPQQNTAPSPGAAPHNSMLDDYSADNSPTWSRTPASPVFNSHVSQDLYRPKKQHDSLGKLYEMDETHDRRIWLDKLLHFMDERGSPITVCPTISKNPLDLYRLYHYVKERGGFMEVTKNKIWKDIAGLLGIGASSSAAYTLRKHYTKNLLPFECHFDRGGIDPQPIINQVEATSKKKTPKAAPVPSPGSSNSQDSFQGPGAGMDGYGGYGGYAQDGYNQQRPPSQSSQGVGVPSHEAHNINVSNPFDDHPASPRGPRPGMPPSGSYQGQPGGQYNQPYGEQYGQPYSGSYPPNRPMYPPYGGPEPDSRVFNQGSSGGSGAGGPPHQASVGSGSPSPSGGVGGPVVPVGGPQDYNRYGMGPSGPGVPGSGAGGPSGPPGGPTGTPGPYQQGPRGYPPPPQGPSQGPPPPGSPSPSSTPPSQQQPPQGVPHGATPPPPQAGGPPQQGSQFPASSGAPPPPGPQGDYYNRQDGYPGGPAGVYPPGGPNKNMPPPPAQPRRHPDFVKENQPAPYPGYNQQRPNMYPAGWSNNNNSGYRGQFPGSGSPGQPQWNVQGPSRPGAPPPNLQANNGQWGPQPPYPPNQSQQGWGMAAQGVGQSSPLRPPLGGPRPTFRPDAKQPYPPHTGIAPHPGQLKGPGIVPYGQPGSQNQTKRELVFPVDSVEATTPVLYKRRRLNKADVAPIDAWRIMMALKSGLLAETCWALDVLNILLFDDTTVAYFGLLHLPGLMDILLEHMKKALADMLEPSPTISPFNEEVKEVTPTDLGAVGDAPDPSDRITPLKVGDFTLKSRKGLPVTFSTESDEDIFITSGKRPWDSEDAVEDAVEPEWNKYIVSCFRAEFGNIPFTRKLNGPPERKKKEIKEETEDPSSMASNKSDSINSTVVPAKDDKKPSSDNSSSSSCSNNRIRKKSKTLSDVLSRIKKEPVADEERPEEQSAAKEDSSEPASGPSAAPVSPARSPTPVLSSPIKDETPTPVKSEPDVETDPVNNEDSENSETPSAEPECKIGVFNIRDPAGTLKRRRIEDYEDECYTRDEASLYLVTETQDYIARRCICLSTILRNLTFVPGNEMEFAKNGTFLGLVGKLLLLHHEHPPRIPKQRKYDRDEEQDFGDCCSSLQGDGEWWWEFLHHLRENALVSIANIAGQVDLGLYPEEISRPILDGLLHWAVCPAAQGQDPFPTVGPSSALSPQRLALEALCKLCVTDSNVDLVIATPPYCRLERLAAVLTRLLCRSEEQVLREFAVNLLYYLGAADSVMARTIAMQNPCVSQLVGFIEQAEQSALGVANQHGLTALRDNPDCMGTSLDMLRRAARTLLNLAGHPDNWPLFLQQEQRLLTLVMSQILDHQVASIIAMVLYQVSRASSSVT